jgi:hypothetical protein
MKRIRTADDVEAELAIRFVPGSPKRSWFDVVKDAAELEGVLYVDICRPGYRPAAVVMARRAPSVELRSYGYSLSQIARPWGMDHTTVLHHLQAAEAA